MFFLLDNEGDRCFFVDFIGARLFVGDARNSFEDMRRSFSVTEDEDSGGDSASEDSSEIHFEVV